MKVRYQKKKGHRYKKVTHKDPHRGRIWIFYGLSCQDRFYYSARLNLWIPANELKGNYGVSSSCNLKIHSLKAALRHIRKHPEIPANTRFRLASNYIGNDIFIRK